MIVEQDFSFQKNREELLTIIFDKGFLDENDEKGVIIKYLGEKNDTFFKNLIEGKESPEETINLLEDAENSRNRTLYIKYNDIYIGGVSLYNLNVREGFGLNKYDNNSFYIGQWENNMKEGIGYLKVDNTEMYVGNFSNNQFDGFGMLFYKDNGNYFLGEFSNGDFLKGIYYNIEKKLFYRGKFKNNKKDDKFCSFFEVENGHIYFGEVEEDEFVKGYLGICNSKNDKEEEKEINFCIDNYFYYDKTQGMNTKFIHNNAFTEGFSEKIQNLFFQVFCTEQGIMQSNSDFMKYFKSLEKMNENKDYIHSIEKYDNHHPRSFGKSFIEKFQSHCKILDDITNSFNIEDFREEFEVPEVDKEMDV